MTNEDQKLLIKYLCASVPYGLKISVYGSGGMKLKNVINSDIGWYFDIEGAPTDFDLDEIKPYLRPISSMTVEENEELRRICDFRTASDDYDCFDRYGIQIIQEINNNAGNHQNLSIDFSDYEDLTDWLNIHHFDYLGLIQKGLAIEAPKDMYK